MLTLIEQARAKLIETWGDYEADDLDAKEREAVAMQLIGMAMEAAIRYERHPSELERVTAMRIAQAAIDKLDGN